MSSPKTSCDNNMQLPSLEELDPSMQPEDSSSDQDERDHDDDELSGTKGFFPALLPGDEPGPSQGSDSQEQQQYIPPDVRHDQNSRSSLYDQLPNSIFEQSASEQDSSQEHVIGPTLPPGFLNNDGNDDDDDPEDPGDPEDPEESGSKPSLPRFPSSSQRSFETVGPALPPGFAQAPSLPDEEFKTSYGSSASTQVPPPEPESVRSSVWQQALVNHKRNSKPVIGPAFPPDVLPTMSSNSGSSAGDRIEGSEDEIYGPVLPQEVLPGPSHRSSSVEIPIEGDEHSNQQEADNVVGPLPPTQEQMEAAEREYQDRLAQFTMMHESLKAQTTKREEWMLQLPKKLVNYGLGARTFSARSGTLESGDHAKQVWTETPSDREKRLVSSSGDEAGSSSLSLWEQRRNADRDMVQERRAEELNEHRTSSLLEMHQRKRKTDSETLTEDKKIRQPFDRERDMEVRGLGKNPNASEIKERMGQLSSRFACSSSKKFL